MAWTDHIETVQKLYVAYYQRPADPGGLRYWAQVIDSMGIKAAVNGFVSSPEAAALYSGDITAVITAVYQSAFNRPPESSGLAYWTNVYNNGWATLGTIVWEIVNGARNQDLITLQNKLESAMNFTNALDPDGDYLPPYQATYSGSADAAKGRAFLADVTFDPTTIKTTDKAIEFIVNNIADPGDPILTSTIVTHLLTTGPDTIQITSTSTIDKIYGLVGKAATDTYNLWDIIEGNNKTILYLQTNATAPYNAGPVPVSKVKEINFIPTNSPMVIFDASSWSEIGSINYNAGVNNFYADIENLKTGIGLSVGTAVTGTIEANLTNGWNIYLRSDTGGSVSFDKDKNLIISAGTNSATFALTNSVTAGVGNATIGDISLGNMNWTAGANGDVFVSMTNFASVTIQGDARIGNITFGDFNLNAGLSGNISMSVYNTAYAKKGNATIGNITFGNITAVGGKDAYIDAMSLFNSAVAKTGNATIGNITIGKIDFNIGVSADAYPIYIGNYAYSDKGNATIGNITAGDIKAVLDKNAYLDIWISNSATTTKGNATIGNITIGNVNLDIGISADAYITISNYASVSTGNATIGNITIGNVNAVLADSAYFSITITNEALASTGNATIGNITIGNVNLDMGINAYAYIYIYNTSAWAVKGNATVGDVTIGDVKAVLADSAYLSISISNSAYATTGNATIGKVTIGNVNLDIGYNADAYINIYNTSAWAGSGNATIGDVTIGDVKAALAQSAYFSIDITNSASATTGNATIGNVTIGNVNLDIGYNADAEIYISNTASAGTGDATIGNVTIGDVNLALADKAFFKLKVDNSTTTTVGDATIGTVSIGDVNAVVGISAAFYLTVENSAYVSTAGDAYAGKISVGNISLDLKKSADAYIELINKAYAWAGVADGGSITVGNINLSLAQDATADIYISISSSVVWGSYKAGNISIGNITVNANTVGNANVNFTVENNGGGNIVVGDIKVIGGKTGNLATFTGWFNPSVLSGKTITVGNIDYSGYVAGAATIDVSGYLGASVIKGSPKGTTITDNKGTNTIILVSGNSKVDTVEFVNANKGKTLTTCDKIIGFEHGTDKIKLDVNTTTDIGGGVSYANFDAFIAAANASDLDVWYGKVGSDSFVAVDYNGDDTVDYVIQVVGVVINAADFILT